MLCHFILSSFNFASAQAISEYKFSPILFFVCFLFAHGTCIFLYLVLSSHFGDRRLYDCYQPLNIFNFDWFKSPFTNTNCVVLYCHYIFRSIVLNRCTMESAKITIRFNGMTVRAQFYNSPFIFIYASAILYLMCSKSRAHFIFSSLRIYCAILLIFLNET